jgi:hypothetical protein
VLGEEMSWAAQRRGASFRCALALERIESRRRRGLRAETGGTCGGMPRFALRSSGSTKIRCAPLHLSSLILTRHWRFWAATFAASWACVCIRLLLVAGATGAGIWQALKSVICRCALCPRRSFHHFSVTHCREFLYFFTPARKSEPPHAANHLRPSCLRVSSAIWASLSTNSGCTPS